MLGCLHLEHRNPVAFVVDIGAVRALFLLFHVHQHQCLKHSRHQVSKQSFHACQRDVVVLLSIALLCIPPTSVLLRLLQLLSLQHVHLPLQLHAIISRIVLPITSTVFPDFLQPLA